MTPKPESLFGEPAPIVTPWAICKPRPILVSRRYVIGHVGFGRQFSGAINHGI
jgi:hypothetical protein